MTKKKLQEATIDALNEAKQQNEKELIDSKLEEDNIAKWHRLFETTQFNLDLFKGFVKQLLHAGGLDGMVSDIETETIWNNANKEMLDMTGLGCRPIPHTFNEKLFHELKKYLP